MYKHIFSDNYKILNYFGLKDFRLISALPPPQKQHNSPTGNLTFDLIAHTENQPLNPLPQSYRVSRLPALLKNARRRLIY